MIPDWRCFALSFGLMGAEQASCWADLGQGLGWAMASVLMVVNGFAGALLLLLWEARS